MKLINKGFSLVELLVVILIISIIGWKISADVASRNVKKNYNLAVAADSAALEVIYSGVTRWIDLNATSISDNTTEEIDLSSTAFTDLLPHSFPSTTLPSGINIRAFVRKSESYPGSGVQIPRAVIIPRAPSVGSRL